MGDLRFARARGNPLGMLIDVILLFTECWFVFRGLRMKVEGLWLCVILYLNF
jgi:hypothetical protein